MVKFDPQMALAHKLSEAGITDETNGRTTVNALLLKLPEPALEDPDHRFWNFDATLEKMMGATGLNKAGALKFVKKIPTTLIKYAGIELESPQKPNIVPNPKGRERDPSPEFPPLKTVVGWYKDYKEKHQCLPKTITQEDRPEGWTWNQLTTQLKRNHDLTPSQLIKLSELSLCNVFQESANYIGKNKTTPKANVRFLNNLSPKNITLALNSDLIIGVQEYFPDLASDELPKTYDEFLKATGLVREDGSFDVAGAMKKRAATLAAHP